MFARFNQKAVVAVIFVFLLAIIVVVLLAEQKHLSGSNDKKCHEIIVDPRRKLKIYEFNAPIIEEEPCPASWVLTADDSFNANAVVPGDNFGSVAVDPASGKIIVAGQGWNVYKFNQDGTLDSAFGVGGLLNSSVAGFTAPDSPYVQEVDGWYQILIDGDYFYLVGNPVENLASLTRMMVQKRNLADGTLDLTFGSGGYWAQTGSFDSEGFSVALNAAGEVFVGGHDRFVSNVNIHSVAKLSPSGILDLSFGNNGFARLHTTPSTDPEGETRGVFIQNDGKIVIAGTFFLFNTTGDIGLGVARFNQDGTLDTSYGENNGWSWYNPVPGFDIFAYDASFRNGDVYVSGHSDGTVPANGFFNVVIKFDSDGIRDSNWANNGAQRFAINGGNNNFEIAESIQLTCDGGCFVCGLAEMGIDPGGGPVEGFIYKLDDQGQLDTDFAASGIFRAGAETSYDQMTIFNNGSTYEIYAVGKGPVGNGTFGVITKFVFPNAAF